MLFVWRGFGLIVPIVFFICAWIVSYFYDDTRLGNASFMGWSCFYTAIVLLLPGFGMIATDPDENGVKRKHDFFFIPVIFWAVGLGALSAYLIYIGPGNPDKDEVVIPVTDSVVEEKVFPRIVNFLNSSDDTMDCVISNEDGLVERFQVSPHTWEEIELLAGSYLFTAFDMDKNVIREFPDAEKAVAQNGFVKVRDKQGEYFQREVTAPTPETEDYDDGWFILDGKRNMMLIDITELCVTSPTKSDIEKMKWIDHLDSVYDGTDLIEPNVKPADPKGDVEVLEPGDVLPKSVGKYDRVYVLMSVPNDRKITSEYIAERIYASFYEE